MADYGSYETPHNPVYDNGYADYDYGQPAYPGSKGSIVEVPVGDPYGGAMPPPPPKHAQPAPPNRPHPNKFQHTVSSFFGSRMSLRNRQKSYRTRNMSCESTASAYPHDDDADSEASAEGSKSIFTTGRILLSIIAVVLVWVTSLKLVIEIFESQIPSPSFEDTVIPQWREVMNLTAELRDEYVECVDSDLKSCNVTLNAGVRYETERSDEARQENAAAVDAAQANASKCALRSDIALASVVAYQKVRAPGSQVCPPPAQRASRARAEPVPTCLARRR